MAWSSRVEREAVWTAELRYLVGNSWLVCATRHCTSAIRAEEFVQMWLDVAWHYSFTTYLLKLGILAVVPFGWLEECLTFESQYKVPAI